MNSTEKKLDALVEEYKFDLRIIRVETREIRDGNKMLFQGRSNIINLDGSIEYGEWKTNGTADNYGDCFDLESHKPAGLERYIPYNWLVAGFAIVVFLFMLLITWGQQ